MRFWVSLLIAAVVSAPAGAQAPVCEQSAIGAPGEVIVSIDARGSGTISWALERREGVGQESDNFARPGLLIDFPLEAGVLGPPRRVEVLISRYMDHEHDAPPPMSSLSVRIRAGGASIVWPGDRPQEGRAKLVERLKDAWPAELAVDVIGQTGELLASAAFDLSKRSGAQALAREARAKCPS